MSIKQGSNESGILEKWALVTTSRAPARSRGSGSMTQEMRGRKLPKPPGARQATGGKVGCVEAVGCGTRALCEGGSLMG